MEIYTTFLDRKKQYCQNDYTTQGNLQIQHNPYQITNDIFTELEQKFFNFCGNTKDSNNQSNPEKEKWSWRNHSLTLNYITKLH